jgi:hypothetical protein
MSRFIIFFLGALLVVNQASGYKKHRVAVQKNTVTNGLKVSPDKHYLIDAITGKPVFLLATTAWNINALNYAEIDTLIKSVSADGFNAIMFALDFYPQADEPNVYGQRAYVGPDKTDLNAAYFEYCDYIIKKCTAYNLYPMVYTMWSGKTSGIMNLYTPRQLFTIGAKIAARYQDNKNVILVAGGESSPPYIDTARVNAMGRGLKNGGKGNNLVTVHPCSPHSNSEFYAEADWLDFYMSQAKSNLGGLGYDLTKAVVKDYNRTPARPTMVGEHRYESGTTEDPVIQRRSLYLSVFAGGFGYAYGHNALWQMTPHTAQPWMLKSWKAGVTNWKDALHTNAAMQLHFIEKLLYRYPYLQRRPSQNMLLTPAGDSVTNKALVMCDAETGKANASYIMAYVSAAQVVKFNTAVIKAAYLNAYWFNPRTGNNESIKRKFKNTGIYQVAEKDAGPDWVVVIEDASKYNYGKAGVNL